MAGDYPNSGIVFRNDKKDGERDRDYRGSIDVTCPCGCNHRFEMWLSGYIRQGRLKKFISLKFKPKDAGSRQPESLDDNVPF